MFKKREIKLVNHRFEGSWFVVLAAPYLFLLFMLK